MLNLKIWAFFILSSKVVYTFNGSRFLVPALQRGNVYHTGSRAGEWEPGEKQHHPCLLQAGKKYKPGLKDSGICFILFAG